MKTLYLIGSLRNIRIPILAEKIRKDNPDVEVFDEWYSAGPEADDHWKAHQKGKGLSYREALDGYAARNVFAFDKRHLNRSTHALLVLPAGRSGHMEIMYAAYGVGAKAAILLDKTAQEDRWDVMLQFIPTLINNDKEINSWLSSPVEKTIPINQDLSYYLPPGFEPSQRCLPLAQGNMTVTTGGAGSNTRD